MCKLRGEDSVQLFDKALYGTILEPFDYMSRIHSIALSFLIMLITSPLLWAQNTNTSDGSLSPTIRSAYWQLNDLKLIFPVIKLNSGQSITLHFDDFDEQQPDYEYRFVLCDRNWNIEERLQYFEYLEGPQQWDLWDREYSSGTFANYAHFQIQIPNEEIGITKSGNYIVQVFKSGHPDSVVLQKRFFVLDKQASIEGSYRPSLISQYSFSHQEIRFKAFLQTTEARQLDPYRDLSASVIQNSRWDIMLEDLKPNFVMDDGLSFEDNRKYIFPGGKEFREFDISTLQYATNWVHHIETGYNQIDAYLQPDEPSSYKSYFSKIDINGRFVPLLSEREADHIESDYAFVHFTLKDANYMPNHDIYIYGQLSDWKIKPELKMVYRQDYGVYEGIAYVKQGFYNYQYVALERESGEFSTKHIEGDSQETENDYFIFLYGNPPGGLYDQLIGYEQLLREGQ